MGIGPSRHQGVEAHLSQVVAKRVRQLESLVPGQSEYAGHFSLSVIPAKAGTQGRGSITYGKTNWNRY